MFNRLRSGLMLGLVGAATSAAPALSAPAADAPLPAVNFPALETVPQPVPANFVETSADKPRLAILFTGSPPDFQSELSQSLQATRRFAVIKAPQSLSASKSKLMPGLLPNTAGQIRTSAKVDMVLTCDVQDVQGDLNASARLTDLRTAEVSRELGIFGKTQDAKTLAQTLALYVRQAAPLRCYVRRIAEDDIILDLGSSDGMRVGTAFQVIRLAHTLKPLTVGVIRLKKLDSFRAHAEVEEARPGLTVSQGDIAVEETGDLALN